MDALDHHKRQVSRFYREIWNRPDLSVVPEILAPDVSFRGRSGRSRPATHSSVTTFAMSPACSSDYRCDIENLVAEADQVVARMRFSGVHRNTFLGVPAAGTRLAWTGAAFLTFDDGLVSDLWLLGDLYGMHEQLRRRG